MSIPQFRISPARSGEASLRLEAAGAGAWVHSALDPRREAENQLARLEPGRRALLVVAGGGLGWLARVDRPSCLAGVLLLEPEESPRDLAPCDAEQVLRGPAEELVHEVTRRQMALGWPDLLVVHNPAYTRFFPAWSALLLASLPPGRLPARLGECSGLAARAWPPGRVLIPDSGYYLVREIAEALATLGIRVTRVPLKAGRHVGPPGASSGTDADPDYSDRLLRAVLEDKPDLLLTVNHLGLDREGRIQGLLASLRIPLAVWYVDSPEYILEDAPCLTGEASFLFCWEKAWIPRLRAMGHGRVEHLPLAGSLSFLRHARHERDFSLVAGSNGGALRKWGRRLSCPEELAGELKDLLEQAVDFPVGELPDGELRARLAGERFRGLREWADESRLRRLASLVVLRATREDRLRLARSFVGRDFVLHGDEDWRILLPDARIRPPLDYYRELADHYRTVRVSLNSTSRQMPGTVNQRLFDAPLAGSLILTDWRADLEHLFDPGAEVLVYREPAEALETGVRAVRDKTERGRLVERARRRIRGEHLYSHRLRRLLDSMGKVLGHGGPGRGEVVRPRAEKEQACASS